MSLAVLLIALAGVAASSVLDAWLPTWVASLAGLALVLVLIRIRRRRPRTESDGRPPDDARSDDAG